MLPTHIITRKASIQMTKIRGTSSLIFLASTELKSVGSTLNGYPTWQYKNKDQHPRGGPSHDASQKQQNHFKANAINSSQEFFLGQPS